MIQANTPIAITMPAERWNQVLAVDVGSRRAASRDRPADPRNPRPVHARGPAGRRQRDGAA